MKVLDPVPADEIPRGYATKYDPIYERALALDGLALPIELETRKQAENFATVFRLRAGKPARLGLTAVRRGKVVFVYRKDAVK